MTTLGMSYFLPSIEQANLANRRIDIVGEKEQAEPVLRDRTEFVRIQVHFHLFSQSMNED